VASQDISISTTEIEPYLEGIVLIECKNRIGSGSLWKINSDHKVLTNYHVIVGESGDCDVSIENTNGDFLHTRGAYSIPLLSKYRYNQTDSVILNIAINKKVENFLNSLPGVNISFLDVSKLNYKISLLPWCKSAMPAGSPVVIAGYPSFVAQDLFSARFYTRALTNGTISAYEKIETSIKKLPYKDYFVSNKVDAGNSGGIAFSKDGTQLCVLGIPTWLNIGDYESQGVVQNIHNVFYNK